MAEPTHPRFVAYKLINGLRWYYRATGPTGPVYTENKSQARPLNDTPTTRKSWKDAGYKCVRLTP